MPSESLLIGFLALLTLPAISAQAAPAPNTDQPLLDCPDANVTDFAVKMLDGLAANGLVTFESLIVGISGGEEGYDLFASLAEYTAAYDATNDKDGSTGYTLLVPSDAAFEAAGYGNGGNWLAEASQNSAKEGEDESDGSWGRLSAQEAIDLMKLHIVHGRWDASKLPEKDRNAVAPSLFQPRQRGKTNLLKRAMDDIELRKRQDPNAMTSESQVPAADGSGQLDTRHVGTILRKSNDGDGVLIKTAFGDVTSWAQLPDLDWTGLKGWNLIPIDFVSLPITTTY